MADAQPNLNNPRLRALQQLQSQMPQANQGVANQQAAARDIQLQNAVQKAPAGTPSTSAGQVAGAAQATNAGQAMIKQAQTNVKQQGQMGDVGIQATQTEAARQLGEQKIGLEEQKTNNIARLAALDSRAKKELYDDQMQFQRNENNRTMLNDIQLSDYAKLNAERGEAYKNYSQSVKQISDRKLQAMQQAQSVIEQRLKQEQAKSEQEKNNGLIEELNYLQRNAAAKIRKEQAHNGNMTAAGGAIGTVAGAVVGAYFGGAGGAMAGGAVGGGLGTAAGSQM